MKQTNLFKAILLVAVLALPFKAIANMDSGLYDPLPPEGAAFVRFINASGMKGSDQSQMNGKGYMYIKHHEASPYFVAEEGTLAAGFDGKNTTFEVKSGGFYSVVVTPKDLKVIEDQGNDNRAKAQIAFYNLTDKAGLSLKTRDGKVAIADAVDAYGMKSRQINPVKVELAIYDGETKVMDVEPLSMDRSMSYNALYTGKDEGVVWVRSTTNTTK